MPKLKPCPFCGRQISTLEVTPVPYDSVYGSDVYVQCIHCEARGPAKDEYKAAIAAWNKRVKEAKK